MGWSLAPGHPIPHPPLRLSPLLSLPLSCREFARWKVNNLALERKDFFSLPLPLAPEFIRNIRLLGRRPSLQQVTDSIIKKYGTHFLLAATLGGELGGELPTLAATPKHGEGEREGSEHWRGLGEKR